MKSFYDNHWKDILHTDGDHYMYHLFVSISDKLKKFTPKMNDDVNEFESHIMDEYICDNARDKEELYRHNWHSDSVRENSERASKITRENSTSVPTNIMNTLTTYYNEHIKNTETIDAWDYTNDTTDAKFVQDKIWPLSLLSHNTNTKSNLIKHVESELDVTIKQRWSLKWWHGMEKYTIYNNNDTTTAIGDIYLKITDKEHPHTTPCKPCDLYAVNLVTSPIGFSLVHEFTHAVHFSYHNFYDVSYEYAELLAISVECSARKKYNSEYSDAFIRRQVGIAMADALSDTPTEFDSNYEKYTNMRDVGYISGRFWHYFRYNNKYWSYAIPLISSQHIDVKQALLYKTYEDSPLCD